MDHAPLPESAAAPPPYHDLLVVAMGHELPGQLGKGWLPPEMLGEEGFFRWTRGRGHLRLNCIPAPMRLWVRVGVPIAPLEKPLAIWVNGRRVWRGAAGVGLCNLGIDLPPALVPGDSMGVEIASRRSIPARIGAGPDRRSLGVMVQRAWIEAAPSGSFRPVPLRPHVGDWLCRSLGLG